MMVIAENGVLEVLSDWQSERITFDFGECAAYAEASDIGLNVGYWPDAISVLSPNRSERIVFDKLVVNTRGNGDVASVTYRSRKPIGFGVRCFTLDVLND